MVTFCQVGLEVAQRPGPGAAPGLASAWQWANGRRPGRSRRGRRRLGASEPESRPQAAAIIMIIRVDLDP